MYFAERKFLRRASHLILKTAQVLCFPIPSIVSALHEHRGSGSVLIRKRILGPSDPAFTAEILIEICRKKKVPIKVLLTDQKVIGCRGNAYVDEILWVAKTRRNRRSDDCRGSEKDSSSDRRDFGSRFKADSERTGGPGPRRSPRRFSRSSEDRKAMPSMWN